MVGTIDYMPPERIEGHPGDARSDVYSLGCVLYEMLTGEPPFVRESEGARMYAHMSAEIPWATDTRPEVPAGLSAIAKRAMAKKPDERFQTATDMARTLARGVPTEPSAQPGAQPTTPSVQPTVASSQPTRAPTAARAAEPPAPRRAAGRQPPHRRGSGGSRLGLIAAAAAVLVAVVAVVALSSAAGATPAPTPPPACEHRRRRRAIAGARGRRDSVPAAPTAWQRETARSGSRALKRAVVTRIDAVSGNKVGNAIDVGADPDTITLDEETVWVTNKASDTVTRIDAKSAEVVAEIPVGATPAGISLDEDGAPWVVLTDEGGVEQTSRLEHAWAPLSKTGRDPYAILVDCGTGMGDESGGGNGRPFRAARRRG